MAITCMRNPLLALPSKRTIGYSFNILNSVTGGGGRLRLFGATCASFLKGADLAEPYPITVPVGILRRGA